MKITLNKLKKMGACLSAVAQYQEEINKPIEHDELIKLLMKNNRFDWANWLITRLIKKKTILVQYAVYAAEQVIDIYEKKYPEDDRPRNAIKAAKRYLKNPTAKNKNSAAAYANAAAAATAATAATAAAADAAAAAAYAAYAAAAYANAAAADATAAYAAYAAAAYANAAAAAAAAYAAYAAAAYANAATAAYAAYAAAAYANAAAAAAAAKLKKKIIKYGLRLIKLES